MWRFERSTRAPFLFLLIDGLGILVGMPRVRFTHHLKRYFPGLEQQDVAASTVADVLRELEQRHPGLSGYVLDDQGALRTHVNIFVRGGMINDRTTLSDPVAEDDEVCIMQALSGG